MSSNTTIAVIGGTGKSGKFLVRELLRQNIPFRLLVRNAGPSSQLVEGPAPDSPPAGQIVRGDVRDAATVQKFTESCSAIVSTLGQPKGEPSVFSQATRNILAAMQANNIHRYILTTGLNVDTPLDKKGAITRAGTEWMRTHYPETTADKQREYELLAASPVDWTLLRLPLIGLTEDSSVIQTSLVDCPGTGIHAVDLARFLVALLQVKDYIRQAPFLANPPLQ